ncbi:glycosyltransferase involved in cell wall biosynthesis [Dysgonomonas sp. PFB1-18]|uniref:glycosyltransferase n=1 Tax=unclassified Dysgonomonas TaxID=2630389 RepID=UPI002477083C|nr:MULTISPECIES: glycosyltransferase [unclassified Dysgonomonas]MDL2303033.1 glycosyltransferase [Dysgonomonas sp. OttesenSCG-928-D17]MDH6307794.1 glycosyltransferase involved in cell wall biosynthesis [Dysgonomonas sp. PF1-14]MDH6337712.1 glycosyltransferase involved in cell wall biosynthesis [Dysgonomonas sp. PF1-16]MDH6378936.1 glycosyltransferase involved in cell wall biosynthesis [Dysgonomonas sp. PFB1-18]MDH6396571.1 glycosyltransferase involved in cell wall biosynthesis [Dysgonomonas sp
MKIFQIITVSEYGGAQTIVANLIKTLSPEHELFVLYGGDGEAWNNLGDNFTKIKLNSHRKEISWRDIGLLFKLFYYRFKYKPDVVHLHSSKMGVLGRIAFSPKKIVYTVHGFDSIRKAFRKFLIIEKSFKNRAFRIIGVSRYDVEMMQEEGISKNVECIYNGVTDEYVEKYELKNHVTEELEKIKQSYPKIVMCISRISKQKKFELFVDIARDMPQYAFVWIGNKEKIKGLPDNAFCLGEMHSAFYSLKYADVFILPSNYEGLPMSLLEALSYKVPVVASAVGGITEVLDGRNGFAVENDQSIFIEKIEYILSDEERQKTMSDNARQSYLANFTIEKMVDGYTSVFNEIIANKR